jgi:uncharacterized DUF497 family protein
VLNTWPGIPSSTMKRPFDENKRRRLIRERGIDLADAHQIFDGPTYTLRDARRDYGEARYFSVGFVAGRMYVIIWTRRDGERRYISMRKANEREQARYAPLVR